jgi:hypothetical protein
MMQEAFVSSASLRGSSTGVVRWVEGLRTHALGLSIAFYLCGYGSKPVEGSYET